MTATTLFDDIGLTKRSFSNALTIVSTASTAATCAEAPSEVNIINAGTTSTGGYRLPSTNSAGLEISFINNSGTVCTVYPPTGGQIDAAGADVGVTVAAATGSKKSFYMTGTALLWKAGQIA